MTKRSRLLLIAGGVLIGLLILVVIAGVIYIQTPGFQNFVRAKVVSAIEDSTGGRAEVQAFRLDLFHLRAQLDGLVIHGNEPAGEPPFVRIASISISAHLFSGWHGLVGLNYLIVQKPEVNVITLADGRTNIPSPKTKSTNDTSPLKTVVDLQIRQFEINNGLLRFSGRESQFGGRGQNLQVALKFNFPNNRYQGNVSINPLFVALSNPDANRPPLLITLNVPVVIETDRIRVANATIETRESRLVFTGAVDNLKSPITTANMGGRISLGELASVSGAIPNAALKGDLRLVARARFASSTDYNASAQIDAPDVLFRQGNVRLQHAQLNSSLSADPRHVVIQNLKIRAAGGEITATGHLDDNTNLAAEVDLRNFDIQTLLRTAAVQNLPYTGVIAGSIQTSGNIKASSLSGINARLQLAISPRQGGIPVNGRVNANYDGLRQAISIAEANISLPNSRLNAKGEIGRELDIDFISHNLSDLPLGSRPVPMSFTNGGNAALTARVTGPLRTPVIAAHMQLTRFSVSGRNFEKLAADLNATSSGAAIQNGTLSSTGIQAQFSGSVGLRNWSPENREPVSVDASIRNADLADLLALAGQTSVPATGTLNASAKVMGTIGNPQGTADLSVNNGTIYDDSFDSLIASVRMQDRSIQVPSMRLTAGKSVVELNAQYTHPPDQLTVGHMDAQLTSSDLDLAQFKTLQRRRPGLGGIVRLNAKVSADATKGSNGTDVTLSALNANLLAQGIRDAKQTYGDATLTAQSNHSDVDYRLNSNFAGSTIAITGQTKLAHDYPTDAHAAINGLAVEKVLSLAGSSVPAQGTLSLNADFSGTKDNFKSNTDFRLLRATLYQEPIDRIEGTATYAPDAIAISKLAIAGPSGNLDLTANFSHPPSDFQEGRLDLKVSEGNVNFGRSKIIQKLKPGLTGTIKLAADIAADLRMRQGQRQVLLSKADASGGIAGLALNRQPLGDATWKAETHGNEVVFDLQSSLASADIRADGQMRLAADYPLQAKLSFKNVRYSGLQPLMGVSFTPRPGFDALIEGQLTANGSALDMRAVQARLQVDRLEISGKAPGNGTNAQTLAVRNTQPIVVSMNRNQVRIESATFTGPSTQLSLSGTTGLASNSAIDLTANGQIGLDLLREINRDLYAKGSVTLNATAKGTLTAPSLNGKIELKDVSLNAPGAPNGISNAQGVIVLNETTASIQSLTAEVGGGKTMVSGFAGLAGGTLNYDLNVNAKGVRTREVGASVVTDIDLRLAGNRQRSNVTGDIAIQQVSYTPDSDFGSMLTTASTPASTPGAPSPFLSNMRLNVRIRTAPGASFRTTLAQTLDATADLRLRGTAARPGMDGRINIVSGDLVFFGNQYTVNQGVINFYDPNKIEPVLDISLQTRAQGVDVTLSVSGPMDDLKLSYTSNPPLRFEEIVALLATGKTPSDPTIAAHQPAPPNQGIAQMGESALVAQGVANPLANRLQRVFGVTQLKINPTFTTGSWVPQARLTLQQQVSPEITFSYTTDVSTANPQLIRVEWAFSSRFSAVVTRDENGIVGLDFFYKKRFR